MDKVKCECGHVNPHGTVLCESCGKPLEEEKEHQEKQNKLLNMRYEGSARRSQTYNRTIIDKIWNFFSSVKVGVWLIVITLIASSLGTIFPQEIYIPPNVSPANYYKEQYGFLGELYYTLGFHNLYSSWWFMLMIASIAISLVVCSVDRFFPLYRALKKQRVTRHPNFLKRQRLFGHSKVKDIESNVKIIKERLQHRHYRVREENGNLLAEKGRFSRWGPYVNHIGLIIFLIGAMLRFVPGMYIDDHLWLRDGETKVIPGTNQQYYLKSEGFIREVYDEDDGNFQVGMGMDKNFQTNAVLYKAKGEVIPGAKPQLEKVKEYDIRVNHPLKFDGYAIYQTNYKLNELYKMAFTLERKSTGETFGKMVMNLDDPSPVYKLKDGYQVEIINYFPNFYFNDQGEPDTKNNIPDNPAFVFKMITPEKPEGEVSFVGIRTNIEPFGENEYKMSFAGIETRNVTGLTVRRDYTLGFIIVGGIIFMLGVIQGMYWNHRRIWLQRVDDELWIAAHTNKNWYGLKKDIDYVIEQTEVKKPLDQREEVTVQHVS